MKEKYRHKRETFPIKGMHCSKCALVIERTLMEMDGIDSAVVNLSRKQADINYDSYKVSIENINKELNSIGYEIGEEKTLFEKIKGIYKNIKLKGGDK